MNIDEMFKVFKKLGLQRPSSIFVPFGHWSEEPLSLETELEEAARESLDSFNASSISDSASTQGMSVHAVSATSQLGRAWVVKALAGIVGAIEY